MEVIWGCKVDLDYHWVPYICECKKPVMEPSETTRFKQGTTVIITTTVNKTTQLLNPGTNGATASGQDAENVSEKNLAKQTRELLMKKFNSKLRTKLQVEKAPFKRRRPELEMQMRRLITNALTNRIGAWTRAQSEENIIRKWWCSLSFN